MLTEDLHGLTEDELLDLRCELFDRIDLVDRGTEVHDFLRLDAADVAAELALRRELLCGALGIPQNAGPGKRERT